MKFDSHIQSQRAPWSLVAVVCSLFGLATAALCAQEPAANSDEVRWTVRAFRPDRAGTIQVQSNLVETTVVVRDGRGNLVHGLAQQDFKLFDNAKEEKISLFSVESAPARSQPAENAPVATVAPVETAASAVQAKPRYIALLMDDTSMPNSDVVNSRRAAEQFVRESMLPGDKAGVFTTSTQVTQMFTEDRQAVLAALGKVVTHQKRADFGPGSCPRMNVYQAHMIMEFEGEHSPEFDLAYQELVNGCGRTPPLKTAPGVITMAVMQQARQTLELGENFGGDTFGIVDDVIRALSKLDGKRVMVMASSGFWSQTIAAKREKVIDEALRAGVVINALDAKGLDPEYLYGKPEDGPPIVFSARPDLQELIREMDINQRDMFNDPLAQMADATGGRFFHNNNDLGRGLREMAAVPEVSYVLGFSPAGIKPDGKFHELKVKVPGHGDYTLTARKGYFAPSSSGNIVATAPERRSELEREVMADDVKKAMPVDLNAAVAGGSEGVSSLRVDLQVGVQGLPFEQRNDRKAERLILVTALFDSENNFLSGAEGILDLSLKDDTWKQLRSTGVSAHLTLTAPQGKYRLWEVVQEEGKGMMSAFSRPVEIQ